MDTTVDTIKKVTDGGTIQILAVMLAISGFLNWLLLQRQWKDASERLKESQAQLKDQRDSEQALLKDRIAESKELHKVINDNTQALGGQSQSNKELAAVMTGFQHSLDELIELIEALLKKVGHDKT